MTLGGRQSDERNAKQHHRSTTHRHLREETKDHHNGKTREELATQRINMVKGNRNETHDVGKNGAETRTKKDKRMRMNVQERSIKGDTQRND